jgi:glutathione S-transferase
MFAVSNPGHTARLMLAHKGIPTTVVNLLPGVHPLVLWAHGFRRGTVPALRLQGRRIEGSLQIAQALERLVPEPPLYPAEPAHRRAVSDAELWGESQLQPIPRRIFRFALAGDSRLRGEFAAQLGVPLPRVAAALNLPVARAMAARAGADETRVRSDLSGLRATLARVDELIETGVIGGSQPNAADFQILPTVRLIGALDDLAPAVQGRPCGELAERMIPQFPRAAPFLGEQLLSLAEL